MARDQFRGLKARAAEATRHEQLWNAIKEVVENRLSDMSLALDQNNALKGSLANIFRVKPLPRVRLFYIASSVHERVVVLMIGSSPRKAGDSNDPYEELTRRLRSTEFDQLFTELGITKPKV